MQKECERLWLQLESNTLQIPTSEMLRLLRLRINDHKLFYDNDLGQLATILGIPLIEIELKNDLKAITGSSTHNAELEIQNSKIVFESLRNLSPAMATDERIWFALAMSHYKDYAFKRWMKGLSEDNRPAAIKNHLFASSPRNRFRDHAIARLWWMANYADRIIGEADAEKALLVLNLKRRYAGDFLDRTGISSSPGLARAIIRVAYDFREKLGDGGQNDATDNFRTIMKDIDLMVGRKALAYPGYEAFEDDVRKKFTAKFGPI